MNMLFLLQQPIVVDLGQPAETARITYTEVILSAFGLVGVIAAVAAIVGIAVGGVIVYRKRRDEASTPRTDTDHVRLRI
jgi:hypothetical protein